MLRILTKGQQLTVKCGQRAVTCSSSLRAKEIVIESIDNKTVISGKPIPSPYKDTLIKVKESEDNAHSCPLCRLNLPNLTYRVSSK
jgi:hypothetical protein